MAFKKVNINETMRNTVLVLLAFPLIVSANIDCGGKAFHCVNSTHFMICVDLGSGVSSTIDDFVIPCPPSTACHKTNYYECEFPLSTTLAPTSASSVASEVITISEGTVSQAIPELATEAIFTETDIVNAGTLNAQSVTDNHLFASIVESTTLAVDAFTTEYVAIDNKLNSDLTVQGEVISKTVTTETILSSTTNVDVPSASNNTFTDNVIKVTTDSFPIDISERTETVNLDNVITQTNKVLAESTTVMSTSFAPELNKSISTVVAIGPDITTTNDSYLVSTTTEYFADTSLLISDVTIDKTTIDTFTTESSLIYTTDSKDSVTNMHKAYFNETTHKFSTEANVSDHMTYNTSAIESVIMPTDGTTYDTTETNANTQGHRMTANELPTIQNVSTVNEIETTSIAIETISEVTDPFIIDNKIQDYSTKINEVTQGVLSLIKVSPTLTIEKNLTSSTQTKISNSNQSTNELEHKIHTIPPTLTILPESTIASHAQNILIDVTPKISKQTTPKPNHVITERTTLNIDTLAEGLLYSQTEQTSINENNFIPSRNMLTGANLDVSTTTSFPPPISTELPLYGIQETITGSNFLVSASEPNVNSNFEVLSTAANPTQSTFSAITDATSADVSVPLSITQTVTDATFYVIPTSDPEFLKEVEINYTDGISTDNIISTADSQTTAETYDIHKETINQSSTPKYTTKISVDSHPSRQVLIKKNETINKTISLDTTTEGSPSIIGGTETISGVLKTDNQITLGQSPEMRTTTFDADMVTQTPLQIDGTLINLKKPISFNIATTEANYETQPSISSFGTITEGANFSQVLIEPNNKIQTTTSDLKTLTQSTSFSESQQIANSKVSTKSNYETTTPLLKTKTPLLDINTDSSTVSVTLNQAESELNFGIKTSTLNLETDAQGVIFTQTEPVSIDTKIAVSIYETVTEINKSNKMLNLSETITTVANLSKIEGIDNGNFVDVSQATSDQNYVVQTTLPNPVIIIEGKPTFKQEEQSNVNISLSSTKTITESYFAISTSAFTSGMLAERKPLAEVVIDKVTITEPSHTIVATESIFETTTKGSYTEDINGIIPLTTTEAITKQNKETVKVPLTNIHSITYDPTETSVQSITESNYKIQSHIFNEISEKTLNKTDDGASFSTSIPMTTNQVISQIIHFENQTPTHILQPITEKSQLSQVHKTINERNANINIQKIKPTITTSSTLKSTNMETSVLHNKNTNKSTFNQQKSSIGIQNNLVTMKVNKTGLNSIRTTELSSAIHNTTPKVIEKSSLSDKVNKERSFTDSQFGQISQTHLPTMTGENGIFNNAVIRNEVFGTDITALTTIDETGNIKATKNYSATVGKTTHIVKGIVENPTENKVTRLEGIPTVTTKQVNVQNTDTKFVTDAYLSGSIKSISASTYNQQAETTEPLTTNESHTIQTNDKNVKIEGIDNVRTDFEVTNKTFNSSVTESLNLNDNTRISGTPLSSSTVVYKDTYKKATPKTHSKINFTDENTNFNSTSNGSNLESQAIIPNIGNITIHPREKIVKQTVSLNEMNEHVTSVHTNVSSNNSNAHRINAGQPGISYSPQPETTTTRQQRLSNIEHSNNNLKTIAHKLDVIETSTIAQLVNNEMLRQPVQVNFKDQINPKIGLAEHTDSPKISERDSNGRVQSKVQHKIITPYLSATEKTITSQWPSLNKSKTIREVPIVVQRVNVASNLSIVQSTKTTLGAIPDQPNQNKTKQINRTLASHTGNKVRNSLSLYCRNRSRGRYSDHNDCTKFYICIGRDQPIVGNCPANTVFSDLNKQCTKNKAHCIRNNEFKCVSEGRFSDILKQNVYYICVKGMNTYVRFEFRCQNGYHLDKATVKCTKEELPQQSASSDKSKREEEEEKTSSVSKKSGERRHNKTEKRSKVKSKQEFECTEEGKFVDPNNCKKYYVCTKNKKSEFRRKRKGCDSDELFNNEKKKCVDKDSYEC